MVIISRVVLWCSSGSTKGSHKNKGHIWYTKTKAKNPEIYCLSLGCEGIAF